MCICRLVARVMKILGIWPWFRVWPQKNFEDLHIKWYKNLRCGEEIQEQLDTTGSRPLQGSLDTTGSRRLHGSAPGGHWTLPGSGPSLGQPPGEGRPPVHTTSCHVLFPGDALSHFLAKNASERGVVTGWPLVWKTWKCQGIWQLSGKCRGFH